MTFSTQLRDQLAGVTRTVPSFRGKARLGAKLADWLTDPADTGQCLRTFVMRDGTRMAIDLRSRTERWAYWTGEYESHATRRLAALLRPGATLLDVGANVGFFTACLGRRLQSLGGGGAVHAFEPFPANVDRLRRVVGLNGLDDLVTVHPFALGEAEGRLGMAADLAGGASTGDAVLIAGDLHPPGKTAEVVRVRKLDDVAEEIGLNRCDAVKMDVEGAELMVLRGGETFFRRTRPTILGEFNPYWMKQFGHAASQVGELLFDWGYRYFRADGRRCVEVERIEDGMEDVWLVPEEATAAVAVLSRDGSGRAVNCSC